MTAKIIIDDFENSTDLCENWGWYVDLESPNQYPYNQKYRIRKLKQVYIVEIYEQESNENVDEYNYNMNQSKKYKIKNSLETIFEEEEEEEEKKNYKKKIINMCNILRITSVTIITCILTYVILFTI